MPWKPDYPLRSLNSFGIDERAQWFRTIHQLEELKSIPASLPGPLHILGGGSNVLVCGPQRGWMIHNQLKGIRKQRSRGDQVWVEVASGEIWDRFVQYCLEQQWAGVENLSLIPGSVGAAPMQNIGAYGVEVKEVIETIHAWDISERKTVEIPASQCAFGYRDSRFKKEWKGKYFLTSVVFRLSKNPRIHRSYSSLDQALQSEGILHPDIHDISRMVRHIRRSKLPDPARIGNAGSFFKNPVIERSRAEALRKEHPDLPVYALGEGKAKVPAAWFIEKAGWKGFREGRCGVHDRQALVLVNYGGARGEDILHLSQRIMDSIQESFGIELEREVQVWDSSRSASGNLR